MKPHSLAVPSLSRTNRRSSPGLVSELTVLTAHHIFSIVVVAVIAGLMAVSTAQATITESGDIYPATAPSSWSGSSNGTTAYIGYQTGNGTLTINGGSSVKARTAYLGNSAGLTGTVSVTGSGSVFNPHTLYVGNSGTGNLSIASGGTVTTNSYAYLGYNAGSTGTVTVDGAGSTFSNAWPLFVGYSGSGSLSVTNGAALTSGPDPTNVGSYIGYNPGATGTVTIDGAGSSWTNSGGLIIGSGGTGTLNITNGSSVSVTGTTTVGANGAINFGANGGTLTTGSLYAGASQLSGTGTITTSGLVTDANLVFNASQGASQSFAVNGVTVNLDLSSGGNLGVGYLGSGTLSISGGVNIASNTGYLGYNTGSTGTATVTGPGSAWTNSGTLYVGNSGTGSLSVTNGGSVTSYGGYIGYNPGSTGTVTIDGAGSSWTNSGTLPANNLTIGGSGTGTLNITNGSVVTVAGTTIVGSLGTVNFGSSGGTLNTGMLNGASSQFSGTGTVIVHGWLGDLNLAYNGPSTAPVNLATWTGANQNVTVGLDLSGSGGIYGNLAVGYQSSGSLVVENGAAIATANGYIGYNAGSTGTATVTGPGSTWTNSGTINVGNYGTGSLSVTNGGVVSGPSGATVYVGYNPGSTGTVIVDGAGSQLNPFALSIGQFGTGVGRIINGGSAHAQSVSVGLSAAVSGWTPTGPGTLYVDGSGSTVLYNSSLYVGHQGDGSLIITNGANVYGTNSGSGVAVADLAQPTAFGTVVVDGAGSNLSTGATGSLTLGSYGTGVAMLSVSDGASLYAGGVYLSNNCFLTTDVGSSIKVGSTGTGAISASNLGGGSGTVRFVAGADAAAGTYTPLSVGTIASTIGVQALGGAWNSTNNTVTVNAAATGATGTPVSFDLSQTQRALITDAGSGKSVGAGFQATTSPTSLSITASLVSAAELSLLQSALGAGQSVLSDWTFSTTGYTSGSPVYLSLFAGPGQSLTGLAIWDYSNGSWTQVSPSDLAYDNIFASFTALDLDDYAVTGNSPVPIPGAVWLLGSGLFGLMGVRKRRRTGTNAEA